jgi:adenosylhomocysteine nucleosidase
MTRTIIASAIADTRLWLQTKRRPLLTTRFPQLAAVAFALCVSFTGATARADAAETLDATPRAAVMSAFVPEWTALQGMLRDRKDYVVNRMTFATGIIEDKPVVLFLSGISMINAAMATQLALDRFTIDKIVFSGIAGGVDPKLTIGDVVVPDAWSEYLESVFARAKDGPYAVPGFAGSPVPNYGMMFPQPVEIAAGDGTVEKRMWFPVDAKLLAIAKNVAQKTMLKDCTPENVCLAHKPMVLVGGHGVSGQAFVDNAAFRDYAQKIFGAEVLDMESAGVAQVAYANRVPFIAFRSLSDLAGGGDAENEMGTFFQLASDNSAAVVREFLKTLP